MTDSTVSGNTAAAGAGVANTAGGAALVTDSTVAGNTATGTGGGIDNDDSTLLLGASTVAGNQATHGGGIANGDGGVAEIADTIVAGSHTSGGDCDTTGDSLIDVGGNLDDDGSCGLTDTSDLPDTAAGLDPAGLQDNGGPTATISLQPSSAAIGAVDDADACSVPDQRGGLRPTPCDIGAYQTDAGQTITFTSAPPPGVVLGDAPYTVSAAASSGLAVTLSVDATATSVCSLSGASVSFTGGGTCTIDARQGGNAHYAAAPPAQQSFTVNLKPQAITFTTTAPAGGTIGGPTYTVAATGGASGNPVVFSIAASSAPVCTVTGATVSFTGQGTCVIDADQAGTSTYSPAPEVYQVVTVALIPQVITFTSLPPPGAAVGGTYMVTATGGGSGKPVTFSLGVFNPPACTLSGATVTFVADGECEIVANQAGSTAYAYAPTVIQAFTVGLTQYFTSAPSATAVVGKPLNFKVTTAGTPAPSLKTIGKVPKGIHLVNLGNGTATLSGTPKKAGVDNLTLAAVFGKGKKKNVVYQAFTLTVSSP